MQPASEPRQDPAAAPFQDVLDEHDMVALTEAVTEEGTIIPAGTIGTIVGVWAPEEAFEVEFADPEAVVTLRRSQVKLYQRLAH